MQAYFESLRDYDTLFHIERKQNDTCPAHFHSNIELLYVLDGEIDVTVGGQTRRLPAGALAVSNSFDVHAYHTPAASQTIFLIIPADTVDFYQRLLDKRHFSVPFLYAGAHSEELENALRFLEKHDRTPISPVSLGYVYVILGILLQSLELVPDAADMGTDNLIRTILVYLDKHFLEPVTMQDLADAVGYNRSYLSRVFGTYVDVGFNGYVNRLRVRHAALLIRTTDLTMARVAEESGFSSVRTFNRVFQELYQITPLAYKLHKKIPTDKGMAIDHLFQVYSYLPPST